MDRQPTRRLAGNKVIRRRLSATQVIAIPPPKRVGPIPHVRSHAKKFTMAYAVLVLVGSLLLALPWTTESGNATQPVDAFFTAVSASAVTGLIVVDTQDHWNFFGELIILLLVQLGGLGFMVGAAIILTSLGRGLSLRDSLMLQDGSPTLSLHEATVLSKRVIRFIIITEAIGAVVLSVRFLQDNPVHVAIWKGIFTSVTAFCNAGFDLQGNFASLSAYHDSWWISGTVMVLIQCGSLSYIVFSDIVSKRRWKPLSLDVKLVTITNALLLLAGAAMFLALEWNQSMASFGAMSKALSALFQSVSLRTAGFATINFGDAHPATLFLSVAIMFVGGAAGSTAGGIKLATVAILAITVMSTVRGDNEPQAFGRRISTQLVFRAMAVASLFLFAHFIITLALVISEDVVANNQFGFMPLMFETMSAMATVGLSTGITPETSTGGRIILCAAMFLGRLGPLMAVYALQRRQQPARYRFPESQIRIG